MTGTAPPAGAALYRPPRAPNHHDEKHRHAGPQIPSPPSPASGTKRHAGKQTAGRATASSVAAARLVQINHQKRAAATAYPGLCAFVVVKKVVAGNYLEVWIDLPAYYCLIKPNMHGLLSLGSCPGSGCVVAGWDGPPLVRGGLWLSHNRATTRIVARARRMCERDHRAPLFQ